MSGMLTSSPSLHCWRAGRASVRAVQEPGGGRGRAGLVTNDWCRWDEFHAHQSLV